MAKNRMAGDKLKEASESSDLSAKEEGYRNSLERSVGTEQYDEMAGEGFSAKNDKGQVQAREVIAEFRDGRGDRSVNDGDDSMVSKYQSMVDSGEHKFNARARAYLEKQGVSFDGRTGDETTDSTDTTGSTGDPANNVDADQKGDNDNVPSNEDIKDKGEQEKQAQEKLNQTIQKVKGNNKYEFTPASDGTLAGKYEVDDSPRAQRKFNNLYKSMNKGNSRKFAGQIEDSLKMFGDYDARSYTPESMANAIGRSTQYSYDRADRQTGHVFGDIWNDNYITEEWKMPSAPAPITSNAEEIADKAKDDIEDL